MSRSTTSTRTRAEVRRFELADLHRLRDLDRAVWNRDRSVEWFRWKYVDNPYVDHPPIFLAEREGDLVGARPFLALRLQAGGEDRLAFQPADTMVHPAHRREGIFTQMTEHALDRYGHDGPALYFNFPNEAAIGGYRKLGWRVVGPRRVYYRVQDPGTFLEQLLGDAGDVLGTVARPVTHQLYRLRSRWASIPDAVTVEHRDGAAPALFASLAEQRQPDALHARRDREFYEWYFSSPAWEYTTVVAHRHGAIEAALLARTRTTDDGVRVTQLAEVAPLSGDDAWRDAVAALVAAVVRQADDADLLSAVQSAIPREVLARYGFFPGTEPPLRQLRGEASTFVVRPATPTDPDAWQLAGRPLTNRDSWRLTFCEHDTA